MPARASSCVLSSLRRIVAPLDEGTTSDGELLHAFIARRDEAAFERLLRRHGPMVLSVCRRLLGEPADAEDAFQATFLVLVRRADSIRKPEQVAAWIHGVARRTALKMRLGIARRRQRYVPLEDLAAEVAAPEIVWRELGPIFDQEISRLPSKYQLPVVLCCLQGRTKRQAARQLGWAEGTLSSRLQTARETLQRRLTTRGLAPASAAIAAALSQGPARAAVPFQLVVTTRTVAAAQPATSLVSAKAVALAREVLTSMFLSKCQAVTASLFVACALGAGGLKLVQEALAQVASPALSSPVGATPARHAHSEAVTRNKPRVPIVAEVTGGVESLAWSPDGHLLATVTNPGGTPAAFNHPHGVKLWDPHTGKLLRTLLETEGGRYSGVAFSPDGQTVAVVLNRLVSSAPLRLAVEIRQWEAATGKEKATLDAGADHCYAIAFSSDGKMLAAGGPVETESGRPVGGHVKVFDPQTGKILWEQRGEEGKPVQGIAFSPDGKTIASTGTDATVKLWDAVSGGLTRTLRGHNDGVYRVTFSPDGKTLASSGLDGTIRIWDVRTGKVRHTIEGYRKQAVSFVAFPPQDGNILLVAGYRAEGGGAGAGKAPELRLFDARTGKPIQVVRVNDLGFLRSLAFSPDGKTLALAVGLDLTASKKQQLILLPFEE
jgi:RNA polymerase sigma factor (sigma-70 family)